MPSTKLIMGLGLLGGLFVLARQDLRRGGAMVRQNLSTIRGWMEKAGKAAEDAGKMMMVY